MGQIGSILIFWVDFEINGLSVDCLDNLTGVDSKPFNSPVRPVRSNFSIFERNTRSKSDHNPYDK